MTPAECREAVRLMFAELYPKCKVIYSYPNAVRPPLPYIVLDFESVDTTGVFESIEDGTFQQRKSKHKDSLVKALGRINGKALSKLVSELLLEHSNVLALNPEDGRYKVMTEDDFDEIFCQYLAGMLNLCAEVIRLNFSGFFKDASTLFGGLIKVRRAGSSNSMENSTTTE